MYSKVFTSYVPLDASESAPSSCVSNTVFGHFRTLEACVPYAAIDAGKALMASDTVLVT